MNNWKKSLIAGMSFSLTLLGYNTFAQTMTTHAHTQIVSSRKYQLAKKSQATCNVSNAIATLTKTKSQATPQNTIGTVNKNRTVDILQQDGEWVKIETKTIEDDDEIKKGYISKDALNTDTCRGIEIE